MLLLVLFSYVLSENVLCMYLLSCCFNYSTEEKNKSISSYKTMCWKPRGYIHGSSRTSCYVPQRRYIFLFVFEYMCNYHLVILGGMEMLFWQELEAFKHVFFSHRWSTGHGSQDMITYLGDLPPSLVAGIRLKLVSPSNRFHIHTLSGSRRKKIFL